MTLAVWDRGMPLAPQTGATKYQGTLAQGYDAKREESPKWQAEQKIIADMLADLPAGSIILDVPVGTGRFLSFYGAKGFEVWGMDLSQDMLALAAHKAEAGHVTGRLGLGDIRRIDLPDQSVDAAVACRITRWLSPEDCQKAIRELQRVARKRIIFTTREAHPTRPDIARPVSLFYGALDGWHIAANVAGYEDAYRIVMLEPVPGSYA